MRMETEVLMFQKGDYVIYGSEGVCLVEDIGVPDIVGLDRTKTYYKLSPCYRSGTIRTPVDTTILMRPVVTKDCADRLICDIETMNCDLDVPQDQKLAGNFYRDLVRSYDCQKLLSVIKYVFNKQRKFALIKKNLPAVDAKFSKMAEEMVCSELAFVLEKDPKDIKQRIVEALNSVPAV